MRKRIIITAALALVCGCMSTNHTTTSKDGAVTKSSAAGFLVTVDGYEDQAVSPDGILTKTAVKRVAGDVAMMQAITEFAATVGKMMLMASGNTNIVIVPPPTNAVAGLGFAPRARK